MASTLKKDNILDFGDATTTTRKAIPLNLHSHPISQLYYTKLVSQLSNKKLSIYYL